MTSIVESCRISPPHGKDTPEISVPLTFFDIMWLNFHPIRRLIFFDNTDSKSIFFETHLPKLKKSLSLVLEHFTLLAGNILCPLNATHEKPRYRYVYGDAVPFTVSVSSKDFDSLVSCNARDADQFYDYVPQLPPIKDEPDYKLIPVLALQVTLFPGRGICICFVNNHTIGDGISIVSFIKAWALACKLHGSDEDLVMLQNHLPCFDRKWIKDPLGIDAIYWNIKRQIPLQPSTFQLPTNRVRATYVLSESNIAKLKGLVSSKAPSIVHLSSFVVVCAYVWASFVRSGDAKVDENAVELFIFAADARTRMDPPVPANYFGNCLTAGILRMRHGELIGEDGLVRAAEAIAEEIQRVNKKEEALKGAENLLSEFKEMFAGVNSSFGVSGSPRFDLYGLDYGLGKARKVEVVTLDSENHAMSLFKSRDSDKGLEVGLSLPKPRMEAFAALFHHGLK